MTEKGDYTPMTFEDIVKHYENDPREFTKEEKAVIIASANLVRKGLATARLTPSGGVEFQAKKMG